MEQQATPVTLDALLTHIDDAVCVLNRNREFVYFNPAAERLTGFRASELLGTGCKCTAVTDCKDEQGRSLAGRLCPGLDVLSGEVASRKQRLVLTTKDGESHTVQAVYTGLGNVDGKPEYLIVVLRDVAEEAAQEAQWLRTISELREEVERLRQQLRDRYGFAGIVSRSPRMQVVLERIRAACNNSSPVLICGEPGTGKEMVARTIHCNGLQKNAPFITFSVSATAPERIEAELFGYTPGSIPGTTAGCTGLYLAADEGTLFIKDVDRLPASTQVRLLQAMQERAVRPIGSTQATPANVRIIASTTRSVEELVSSGALREDLYYRLNVITIEVPALRLRKEDIPLLLEHFVRQHNGESTRQVSEIAPEVWAALSAHDWPGNVRELQNVIESAFVASSGSVLLPEVVNLAGGSSRHGKGNGENEAVSLDDILCDTERRAILTALRRARGQRSMAAKFMGISRSRLYRRMEALGIASKKDLQ
ncbi:MAG TPA: sigma 54-interacting transcriptional regulator [Phycisphaerae bacterium]|nr:sigma 54-interacting transcriptional regulator [Phycisphaerae bacterium]HOJ76225.1 sigma 54-interacting transcriptional regulator [Phycisphaerae bacterium]HOM53563.1 sigma 54-interacting transcriptional regulator [Phycisphaerae bacterium]HON66522.1 sigma 54-interacting transcriptional regulator [Phycisphaerae bacterium]HOQ86941.1 sigma 54-interacting transcriptional regulator [Phycisphaerae bacterium]